ncbi:MAG: hypothetical protein V8S24_13295 [Gordonibacter pamelaeae]
MPGVACWHEEGRFIVVDQDDDSDDADGEKPAYEGDEVHVLKIPARTETATLLFDPRDIDFAESMNKATYLSCAASATKRRARWTSWSTSCRAPGSSAAIDRSS